MQKNLPPKSLSFVRRSWVHDLLGVCNLFCQKVSVDWIMIFFWMVFLQQQKNTKQQFDCMKISICLYTWKETWVVIDTVLFYYFWIKNHPKNHASTLRVHLHKEPFVKALHLCKEGFLGGAFCQSSARLWDDKGLFVSQGLLLQPWPPDLVANRNSLREGGQTHGLTASAVHPCCTAEHLSQPGRLY